MTTLRLLFLSHIIYIYFLCFFSSIRLLSRQVTKTKGKVFFCKTCLQNFNDSSKLEKHRLECNKIESKMPLSDISKLKFKNFKHQQLDVPFVVYADLECILEEIEI